MVMAPTLGIRNLHLIAEHVPNHARLLPRVQSLKNGHIRQLRHTLIPGQRPAIATTEHFFKQLPKFPFTHTRQCATTRRTEKPAPPNGDAGQQLRRTFPPLISHIINTQWSHHHLNNPIIWAHYVNIINPRAPR